MEKTANRHMYNRQRFLNRKMKWDYFVISTLVIFGILFLGMGQMVASFAGEAPKEPTSKKQIEIAATIYEFRLESEKQLGIFYQYNRSSGSFQDSDVFLHGTENVRDQPVQGLDLTGSFAKLSYGSIDFNIKTAIEEGRAMVINNPRQLVADGERASLVSGEEVPLTRLASIAGDKMKLQLEVRKTGIKLNVLPRILPGNNVLMDLEIESSEIIRLDVFDRGDGQRFELPVVSTRNVKTTVVVPTQKRLYIGGLYTNSASDITRKIPVVGDLPVIGFFLRGFNKKMVRTETVFQITPTIKKPGEGISAEGSIFRELLEPDSSQNGGSQKSSNMIQSATGATLIDENGNVPISNTDDQSIQSNVPRKTRSGAGYRPGRNR